MLSQTTRSLTTRAAVKAIAKRGAATLPLWSESLSFASPESDFSRSHREYTTRSSSSTSPAWSSTLSYTSPETDFTARSAHSLSEHQARQFENSNNNWSHQLSFASPEADFTFDSAAATKDAPAAEWSHTLSFASPESDFVASTPQEVNLRQERNQQMPDNFYAMAMAASPETALGSFAARELQTEWSNTLSFASPESDFVASPQQTMSLDAVAMAASPETALGSFAAQELQTGPEWSHTLSFASPESDFVGSLSSSQQEDNYYAQNHQDIPESFFALAMAASPETAFGSLAMPELLDERMKHQLRHVLELEQLKLQEEQAIQAVLPKTLAEAMAEQDPRAIVITTATAPFEIIHVNHAWEGLCGFTKEEALHHTLSMLQGPETDRHQASGLLQELQRGHAASAVLTNYTKQGRAFKNLIRVAPIRDASRGVRYFVGVLEEIVNQSQWDDSHHNMMRAA